MTDGTSQGLFIVVAIVIFGIFTVLAYILFEDTLSPALATMFTDATDVAKDRLNKDTVVEFAFIPHNHSGSQDIIEQTPTSLHYRTQDTANWGDGVHIPPNNMLVGEQYILSFEMTVLDGTVSRIGGHMGLTDLTTMDVRINGELYTNFDLDNNYGAGIPYNFEKNETYLVEVYFKVKDLDVYNPKIHIQTNRSPKDINIKQPHEVRLDNLQIIQR